MAACQTFYSTQPFPSVHFWALPTFRQTKRRSLSNPGLFIALCYTKSCFFWLSFLKCYDPWLLDWKKSGKRRLPLYFRRRINQKGKYPVFWKDIATKDLNRSFITQKLSYQRQYNIFKYGAYLAKEIQLHWWKFRLGCTHWAVILFQGAFLNSLRIKSPITAFLTYTLLLKPAQPISFSTCYT
jgi:hypothetical protein